MIQPSWYRAPDPLALRWTASSVGGGWRAVRSRRLRGGIANAVDAVVLEGPGGASMRLVLKRWLRPGWQAEDPESTPAREAAVLERLAATDVPAPRPVAVDPDGQGCGVPALLMSHVDGRRPSARAEADPARIRTMADVLARIHAVAGPDDLVGPFAPCYEHARLRVPSAAPDPALWHAAIEATAVLPPPAEPRFLHGDVHPANTIWSGARLVGVVDWASAAIGPVAADLAHWRANLGTRHGIAAADRVLAAYAAVGGLVPADQPWWDARMLLDFIDDPNGLAGAELAGYEAYLGAVLARL